MSEFSEEAWLKTVEKLENRLDRPHSSTISKTEKIILIHFLNLWYNVIHVIKVVMSTTSIERSRIFLALIDSDGKLKTRDIERLLAITEHPARRTWKDAISLNRYHLHAGTLRDWLGMISNRHRKMEKHL